MTGINFWAVLGAAVVRMALGAFWFSPAGFGKPWMMLMGMTQEKMMEAQKKGGMWKLYLIEFIGALITSFVLAFLLVGGSNTALNGAFAGAILWLGLTAAWMISDYTWGGRPIKLFWITGGYQLISMILMGAIVAAWA